MNRTIFLTGIVFGVLAIILGAFGAHTLEKWITAEGLQTFETGVKYQMYHALLLLILGSSSRLPEQAKKVIYYCVVIGVVFFSFSIYFLATNDMTAFDFKAIGFITPIGGLLLIIGWLLLGYRTHKHFD